MTAHIIDSQNRFSTLKRTIAFVVVVSGCSVSVIGFVSLCDQLPEAHLSEWLVGASYALAAAVPLATCLLALRRPKLAGILSLLAAPLLVACLLVAYGPVIGAPLYREEIIRFLGITSLVFIVPGVFWLVTARLGWPSLMPKHLSLGKILALATLSTVMIFATVIALSLALALSRSYGCSLDWGVPPPPSIQPKNRYHTVFVGRIKYIGHIPMAVVQEHFWGLPWWNRKVVIPALGGSPRDGDEIFVDGVREPILFTGIIPVITNCGPNRTARLQDADVDLRVLHDGPPSNGVRIIGSVVGYHKSQRYRVQGAKVKVTSPEGSLVLTTGPDGIFDRSNLPPGEYKLELVGHEERSYCHTPDPDYIVRTGRVWGCTLYLNE